MRYVIIIAVFSVFSALIAWLTKLPEHLSPGYPLIIFVLTLGIFTILGGCELFANGVECLGDRLNMSHATVGSLFAAVGTALPETMVPVLALLFGKASSREGIAVGAILGAPFMISTLAMFLLGVTVLLHFFSKGRREAILNINQSALRLELIFFIFIMSGLMLVSYLDIYILKHIYAIVLILVYIIFFKISLGHEALDDEEYTDNFHFSFIIGCPLRLRWIIIQTLTGLALIIVGAHIFVEYLTILSNKSGISPLVLSLLITPVATELPEKFNSITWTLKGKDTIGLANLTGAMVFQSTIPVAIGLSFTEWKLTQAEYINLLSTIIMSFVLLFSIKNRKGLPAWALLAGGLFYAFYIFRVFIIH